MHRSFFLESLYFLKTYLYKLWNCLKWLSVLSAFNLFSQPTDFKPLINGVKIDGRWVQYLMVNMVELKALWQLWNRRPPSMYKADSEPPVAYHFYCPSQSNHLHCFNKPQCKLECYISSYNLALCISWGSTLYSTIFSIQPNSIA